MELTTVEKVHLWYYDSYKNSDKVYNLELQHNPITDLYSVFFEYGRRGKGLRPGYKVENVSRAHAENILCKFKLEKENKGYDLMYHEKNMNAINPAPYVQLSKMLLDNGIISSREQERLQTFLLSGDPQTITLAINILSARNSTADLQNAA